MKIIDWHGCYDSNWNGLIVPDAFAHPAKYSHGLIDRIFRYMLAEGMVAKGDRVVDPFGGIGTGGIVAASLGLQWFGCELEARFHELGLKNFDLHLMTWQACRDPIPVLVNGDSRKLRENLRGVLAQAVVCSPPYAQNRMDGGDVVMDKPARRAYEYNAGGDGVHAQYGTTPGQLGAMKAGDVAAVVGSPPFLDARSDTTRPIPPKSMDGHLSDKDGRLHRLGACAYGETDGQLSNLPAGAVDAVVTSPPYEGNVKSDYRVKDENGQDRDERRGYRQGQGCFRGSETYGGTPGQLGEMESGAVDAVVTSPPFQKQEGANSARKAADPEAVAAKRSEGYASGALKGNFASKEAILRSMQKANEQTYGESPGQLGNEQGETFWHAARDIVSECYAILRPGGYAAFVVKAFVRNKQIVDFPGDWCKLLEACGFTVTTRVHAMLVKETSHPDLFGGDDHVQRTERKSFFRRLAEKKGSPRIDWEEVVFARKASA